MGKVDIGTVTLEVPGLSASEGRLLAERVAEGLGRTSWPPAAPAAVSIALGADAGSGSVDRLAAAILDALRRQLS
jgi:hypothetical protein